ncbi:hypothetical protein [Maridesulfovibrio sp.]|uniref:hypothetical protein n=1 Tax=Maridesulfovibrio sp. TaxID=2795000 RepID=UPI002A187A9D|nr:hypothetical protein [Maridesulfovibrio sp.]
MADFKEFSDALTDEVLNDMAESYFGARVDVDKALEYFHDVSERLHTKLYRVYRACVLLEKVCLGRSGFDDFWLSAGINREVFHYPAGVECAALMTGPAMSLTSKGEYVKWFTIAYEMVAERVAEYMHGSFKDDGTGRKVRSSNREDFFRMADEINLKIEKVNRNVTASDVLNFTKSLDPEGMRKENIAGCVGPQCKDIDDEMAFTLIAIKDIDFPEFPDLPGRKEISSYISEFCSENYAKDKVRVKALIKELKSELR